MVQKLRTMGFQELLVFSEVARLGGITAAAEQLGLAKSAVSSQLNRLETRLGVTLFQRTSRRVDLTREGRILLPKAESLLAEAELMISAAEADQNRVSGTLRIATTPAFGRIFAGAFIERVRRRFPDLDVIMKLAYEVDDLQDPAFDFALRIGGIGSDERLVAMPLGQFRRVLVAAPEYAHRAQIGSPEDLGAHINVVFSSNSTAAHYQLLAVDDPKREIAVAVKARFAVRSFSLIAELVQRGHGVAYLPLFTARPLLKSGHLCQVLPDWTLPAAPIYLVYRFGAQNIQRVQAALEVAKSCVREFVLADAITDWQTT